MQVRYLLLFTSALTLPGIAWAQPGPAEQIVVYGPLSASNIGLQPGMVAAQVQGLSSAQIEVSHGTTVLNSLDAHIAGVSLSDTQGNPMFQNLRYHGFEASPLQGNAQGLAVYQNGMRLNEAFGDTVNWDAIPSAAIDRVDVWSSNPVFGLNALGGAVNLIMKDGFRWQGATASVQGGNDGQAMGVLQYGSNNGGFGLYAALEGVTDGGYRQHSASNVGRIYLDAGWRAGSSEIHVVASGAQSLLGVVGPTPAEMIQQAASSVYTWPQKTENRTGSLAVRGKAALADDWHIEASGYVRDFRQRHLDGNDADFESCSTRSSFGGDICLEDDAFGTPPGGKTTTYRNQFVILGGAGQPFPFTSSATYGTVDRTYTDATTEGSALQLTRAATLIEHPNYLTFGATIDHSDIGFRSASTLGRIYPDLRVDLDTGLPGSGTIMHTQGDLGYAPVDLGGTVDYFGIYGVDAFSLTGALTLTAGFRANIADTRTHDRSGSAPELNGSNRYTRVNPLAGITYAFGADITAFAGYSEANRAPTLLELDCASETQPCLLEGSLVADPPLNQVVAHTYEGGLRGASNWNGGRLSWSTSLFRTDSDNDIIALASAIQGRGFFSNVPSTKREGIDATAQFEAEHWSAFASYSYLDATYEFTGAMASPNNPFADGDGNIAIRPGNRIPLNPAHHTRIGGDVEVLQGFSLGGNVLLVGSQYYAGDDANRNPKLPGYWVLNLRGSYRFNDRWEVFALVNNVFDRHDATYATFFDPTGTSRLLPQPLTDPRTLTLQRPIAFQIGMTVRL